MEDSHPEAVTFECGDKTYVLKVGMAAFQLAKHRHGIDIKLSDLDRVGEAFAKEKQESLEEGIEEGAEMVLDEGDLDDLDEAMGLIYKIGWAGVLPGSPDLSYGEFLAEVALAGADQELAFATMKGISRMNDAMTDEQKEKLEARLGNSPEGKEGKETGEASAS